MAKIGLIGVGNMGFAMLKGALQVFDKEDLTYTDLNKDRLEEVKNETGVEYSKDFHELVQTVKYVVLAVKPQHLEGLLKEIKD